VIADGVNIAARLQVLAEPGGVCISERVYADVAGRSEAEFAGGGETAAEKRPAIDMFAGGEGPRWSSSYTRRLLVPRNRYGASLAPPLRAARFSL
jgi:class 3 adenylate cyclase